MNPLSPAPPPAFSLRQEMGPSKAVAELADKAKLVAKSDFTVIILGETGCGKEIVARAIHCQSHRFEGPLVAVDCGAIPEPLLESELFGHEKGAFTGAVARRPGKFECARNGTLFLDEISNLTLGSQAKLLRAIQERTIWRVGGLEPFEVDVRLLVACNRSLETPSARGSFRKDLYYRLNEFTVKVPPLRERREDVRYLAQRFLEAANQELGKGVEGFTDSAVDVMRAYDWPGNVRELRAAVRRAVLLADHLVDEDQLGLPGNGLRAHDRASARERDPWGGRPLKEIVRREVADVERTVIGQVLRHTRGNKAEAARLLRVDYKTILTKIRQLGIDPGGA